MKHIDVVGRLEAAGAGGIVLGCTEIPMLLGPDDVSLPLLDTTCLHARAALDFALEGA
jgi:aspartate racemase